MSRLAWTFVVTAIVTFVVAATLSSVAIYRVGHNGRRLDQVSDQNAEELRQLAETKLWRSWFVCEMQRHDVRLGLSPLPWPGKLVDLPPSVTSQATAQP